MSAWALLSVVLCLIADASGRTPVPPQLAKVITLAAKDRVAVTAVQNPEGELLDLASDDDRIEALTDTGDRYWITEYERASGRFRFRFPLPRGSSIASVLYRRQSQVCVVGRAPGNSGYMEYRSSPSRKAAIADPIRDSLAAFDDLLNGRRSKQIKSILTRLRATLPPAEPSNNQPSGSFDTQSAVLSLQRVPWNASSIAARLDYRSAPDALAYCWGYGQSDVFYSARRGASRIERRLNFARDLGLTTISRPMMTRVQNVTCTRSGFLICLLDQSGQPITVSFEIGAHRVRRLKVMKGSLARPLISYGARRSPTGPKQ